MSVVLEKLDGVESVDVSLRKASADIRLEPGNKITLPQLRQIIRKAGYPTKDAQIEAKGTFIDRNGTPMLDLQNGSYLELAAKPPADATGVVDVTGTSKAAGKDRETLTLTPRQ